MGKTLGGLMLATLAVLIVSTEVDAQVVPPACPVVTDDTTLQSDCEGPMIVAASNVSVDLAGHTVRCTGPVAGGDPDRKGIVIVEETRVRIKDGTVTKCGTGIDVSGGGGHDVRALRVVENVCCGSGGNGHGMVLTNSAENRIFKSTVSANQGVGVALTSGHDNANNQVVGNDVSSNQITGVVIFVGSGNEVKNNVITSNGSIGLELHTTRGNRVAFNEISHSPNGISTREASENAIEKNIVTQNSLGIHIFDSSQSNLLTDNAVNHNGTGIIVALSSSNIVERNEVSNNSQEGILLGTGGPTTVQDNTANDNGLQGIHALLSATENTITRNEALGNAIDLQDDNPNCDANVWRDNRFATRFAVPPTCIN